MTAIATALILATLAGLIAVYLRLERSRTGLALLLEEPVRVPPWHPEGWTSWPDATDVQLAVLHDLTWPSEEWRAALRDRH